MGPGDGSSDRRQSARRWRSVGCCLLAAAVLAVAARGVLARRDERRFADEQERARADLEAGYPALARDRLTRLEAAYPGRPEVQFRLGVCEQASGHPAEAMATWERLPPGSSWYALAGAARAALLIDAGRYRPAEEALERALPEARTPADAVQVRRVLARLYRFEGRFDDVRRVLHESWADSDDRVGLLRELWMLDDAPQPVEAWRLALDRADPGDDRVRLGLASVATITGRFDEAARWLDAAERARPDDPAVRRARLDLALASGDAAGVWRAAAGLAAERLGPAERLAVAAWLLARGGDRDAERRALRKWLGADPGALPALDRLAALEFQAGHRGEAESLRRRKADLDRAKDRVRKLLIGEADLASKAGEFAGLASALGRRFDARGWSEVAGLGGPEAGAPPAGAAARGSLADLLAAEGLTPPGAGPSTPAPADDLAEADVPRFVDDAGPARLTFTFDSGRSPFRYLPETMSGGVAALDYDGDGWLDVYCVQGGPIAPGAPPDAGTDRLFRNNRDGTFTDVSIPSKVASFPRDYGLGVAVGDTDGDGRPDIFVTRLRSYALYRNQGDGTFRDATAEAGLAGRRDNPSSAAFADLDNDGDLDLYVCHYMIWDPDDPRLCRNDKGEYFYCDPSKVESAPDHAFRNDGGRFVDVTKEAGFTDPDGRGLGVVAADLDGDGRVELFVGNDGTGNYLFRNLGGFRFEEVALASGVACNAAGGFQASMGIACGDADGDGRPDLAVTNFYGESSTLYANLGGGLFRDRTEASGLGAATRYLLGFGTAFADVDDDGRPDIATANGHVNDGRPNYPYAMPAQLLLGRDGGRFADASARAGEPWAVPRLGRGLAAADLDNDGRLDVLILAQDGPLAYLHNRGTAAAPRNRWVTFGLRGVASNRDGVGAVVTVVAGGRRRVAPRFGGGSYQSAGDPRLHFGLGRADVVDSVEVRWPSGAVDTFRGLPAGTGYLLREGAKSAPSLGGFAPRK